VALVHADGGDITADQRLDGDISRNDLRHVVGVVGEAEIRQHLRRSEVLGGRADRPEGHGLALQVLHRLHRALAQRDDLRIVVRALPGGDDLRVGKLLDHRVLGGAGQHQVDLALVQRLDGGRTRTHREELDFFAGDLFERGFERREFLLQGFQPFDVGHREFQRIGNDGGGDGEREGSGRGEERTDHAVVSEEMDCCVHRSVTVRGHRGFR